MTSCDPYTKQLESHCLVVMSTYGLLTENFKMFLVCLSSQQAIKDFNVEMQLFKVENQSTPNMELIAKLCDL